MSAPTVVRYIPAGQESITFGPTGTIARAWWTVVAADEAEALSLLKAETPPVARGVAWRDAQGAIFDGALLLQDFALAPRVSPTSGGAGLWHVVATYSTTWSAFTLNAIEGRTQYRWERGSESNPADIDKDGKPAINTLGDPLEPPLQITTRTRILVAEFLRAGVSQFEVEGAFLQYENTTNAGTFKGYGPECALCQSLDVEDAGLYAADGANRLFRVRGRFELRRPFAAYGVQVPGHVEARLNRSYQIWNTTLAGGERQYEHARDAAGNRVTAPVLIDADGVRIYVTNGIPDRTPHVLQFRRYATSGFHAIPELV